MTVQTSTGSILNETYFRQVKHLLLIQIKDVLASFCQHLIVMSYVFVHHFMHSKTAC